MAEKQINQDPPVAKENVLLMEIEMKRNSEKPDSSSRRVKKKTIVTGCVWSRISRSLAHNYALLVIFTKMIIYQHHRLFHPCQHHHQLNLFHRQKKALREDDSYLNCAHSQISREGGLGGYHESGDENDND